MKQRRKAQLQEEKRSVRKQKKELKQVRKKRRKKHDAESFWTRLKRFFSSSEPSSNHHRKSPGLWKRYKLWRKERESFRRNRRDARKKLKHQAEQRAHMLKKEKIHSRREKRQMREKTRPMRRKIRESRMRDMKAVIIGFFRQPIKVRKLKEEEKILRKQIREDIRRQRLQAIQNFPDSITSNFRRRIRIQREKTRFFLMYINNTLAGRRTLKEDPETKRDLFKIFFNSLFIYILAFTGLYYASKLVTVVVAGFYNIPAVVYSYRIFWPLYTYSSLYSRQSLILIFAIGPIFSLVAGIVFYRIFLLLRFSNVNFKLLALWVFFHGMNLFFGAYISGVITRTGFVYTTEWLFYSRVFDVEEIIFVIVSIITLIATGFYLSRNFILATPSITVIHPRLRLFYMLAQVLLPWFLGTAILYFINFPNNPPELMLLYATSVLMIIPVMTNFNSPGNKAIKVVLNKQGVRPGWIYIGLIIVALVFIRMVVFYGITFR